VARAKQTARSEARRRYRLANRLDDESQPNELGEDAGAAPAASRATASSRPVSASRSNAEPRPGVFSSFRGAYHPAHIREDLNDLPTLLISRAFLAGIALVIAGAVIIVAFPGYTTAIFLFQTLTLPPAIAPMFVAGFFAPKASYLLVFLIGVVDAIVYAILLVVVAPSLGLSSPIDPAVLPSTIALALFTGAVTGTLFAAAAAWYRRFLSLSSPKRLTAANNANRRANAQKRAARR
jgi:MFS family permease